MKQDDDFPDIPLFDDAVPKQGLGFTMDLSPHAPPAESPATKRFLALLTDSLLFVLVLALHLYLIKRFLPMTPVTPLIIASFLQTLMLCITLDALSIFFWGITPGMRIFHVQIIDKEGEIPDAFTLLTWLGRHVGSILTLGIYGSFIPYSTHRSFYLVDL